MKNKAQKGKIKMTALRVMAEYSSSGIWVIGQQGVFRHGMISHSSLRLPKPLADRFDHWISYYDKVLFDPDNFDVDWFNADGLALATELKAFLGDMYTVEFLAETEEGGLLPARQIT